MVQWHSYMQNTSSLVNFRSPGCSAATMIQAIITLQVAFLAGAVASVLAGYSGMRAATSANGRTAMAAKSGGQPAALAVSYNGGAVMGLSVGGLGLLGISLVAYFLSSGDGSHRIRSRIRNGCIFYRFIR